MKIFTGPVNKLGEAGQEVLQRKIQEFEKFLHMYLHANAMDNITITIKGQFFNGVRSSVTIDFDEELRKEMKKR